MADLSTIDFKGAPLSIKDSTARTEIERIITEILGGNKFAVVTSLPSTVDANTIYFIKEDSSLPGGGSH